MIASASSEYTNTVSGNLYSASMAIDDVVNTDNAFFASDPAQAAGSEHWIMLDLGRTAKVVEVNARKTQEHHDAMIVDDSIIVLYRQYCSITHIPTSHEKLEIGCRLFENLDMTKLYIWCLSGLRTATYRTPK